MIHHYFYLEALINREKKHTTKNTFVVVVDFFLKKGSGVRHFVEEKMDLSKRWEKVKTRNKEGGLTNFSN